MRGWTTGGGARGFGVSDPIVLEFLGTVPSKKNEYKKRSGRGKGMYKGEELRTKLDALAEQIPPEVRNLKLVHPDVTWRFELPKGSRSHRAWDTDPDNKATALTDLLVSFGVFREDSFRYHNGRKVIEPAEEIDGVVDKVTVTIVPKEEVA